MTDPADNDPDWTTAPRAPRLRASLLARVLFVVAAALLPLSVAWALSESGPKSEAGAAPSPAVTDADPGPRATSTRTTTTAVKASPTPRAKLDALRHPLVGLSRKKLIRTLGKPSRRTIEGGQAMEFLEYSIADEEYQVVVLNRRVVEVLRFR